MSRTAHTLCLAAALLTAAAAPATKLGSYGVDQTAVSVSGVSSGGYMAQQYHVAHSKQIMGVGVIAGGPWDCADTKPGWLPAITASQVCSNTAGNGAPFFGPPDLAASIAAVRNAAKTNQIDPLKSLATAKVFLFSGTKDTYVPQPIVDVLDKFYLTFVPAANVQYVNTIPSEHAIVTDNFGKACDHLGPPYINNCGYDTAGQLLGFIYGTLSPRGDPATGTLLEFDQTEFLPFETISMAPTGHIFIPADCKTTPGCRLHVAFHGCEQSQDQIGDDFYAHAGYNEWAATNRIIVLYPQVIKSDPIPLNPDGCWDWYAYTDSHFPTKTGEQIVAIQKMIARVSK